MARRWQAKKNQDGWLIQQVGGDDDGAVLFEGLNTEEMKELARVIVNAVKPIPNLFRNENDVG